MLSTIYVLLEYFNGALYMHVSVLWASVIQAICLSEYFYKFLSSDNQGSTVQGECRICMRLLYY